MEQTKRDGKRIEFFRFNDKTEEWKKLTVENSDGKVFIAIEQGKKGEKQNRIAMKLELQEIALLQGALFKILLKSLDI